MLWSAGIHPPFRRFPLSALFMCRLRSACSNCSRLGGGGGSDVRPRPPPASLRSPLSDATITFSSCLLITIFNRTTPSPSSVEMTIPRVSSSTASSAVTLGLPRQKHFRRPWPRLLSLILGSISISLR
ncbi:unnamed protein product [Musa acuminata var. zebrina]